MAGLYYQPQGLLGAPMSAGLLGRDPMNYDMPPEGAVYADPNNPSMTDKVMGGLAMMPVNIAEGAWEGFKTPYKAYTEGMTQDEMIGASSVFGPLGGMVALGGLGRAGLNGAKPGGELGIFGGKLAKTADHAALARAEKMAAEGVDRGAIWNETGWFQGVDGKWRFEIPDNKSKMQFTPTADRNYYETADLTMKHPALWEAYPDMRHIDTATTYGKNSGSYTPHQNRSSEGLFDVTEEINVSGKKPKDVRSVMLHELEHGVQNREGFARGGDVGRFTNTIPEPLIARANQLDALAESDLLPKIAKARASGDVKELMALNKHPDYALYSEVATDFANRGQPLPDAAAIKSLADQLWKEGEANTPFNQYKRLAGETEARNVQTRMDMTPEQRRATPPWETQDVPDAEQIVRMSLDGPAMSVKPPSTGGRVPGGADKIPDVDYRGSHTAPVRSGGNTLDDLSDTFPDDIYSGVGARYYGHQGGSTMDHKSVEIIQSMRGKPDKTVTVYRAVPHKMQPSEEIAKLESEMREYMRRGKKPKDADPDLSPSGWYNSTHARVEYLKSLPDDPPGTIGINPGDWVTINKQYAKNHGDANLGGEYRIISKKVKARDLANDGDIHEWGYAPSGTSDTFNNAYLAGDAT